MKSPKVQLSKMAFTAQQNPPSLWRVWLWIGLVCAALMLIGFRLGDRFGLLFGFFSGLAMVVFILMYSDWRISHMPNTQEIEGQDEFLLKTKVLNWSKRLQMHPPRVFKISNTCPTVLSLGIFPKHSALLISESLLAEFKPEEIEAAIVYELLRIRSRETLIGSVAAAVTLSVQVFANFLDHFFTLKWLRRTLIRPSRLADSFPDAPFSAFAAPLIAGLTRILCRRRSYYELDLATAKEIGSEAAVASLLWKLNAYCQTQPLAVAFNDSHLYIINPMSRHGWWRVWQLQPKLATRIHLLLGRFPI